MVFHRDCSDNIGVRGTNFYREVNRKDTHMRPFKNILLVYPCVPSNTYWSFRYALPFIRKKSAMSPLGLITVAALIPDGYRLKLVDMNIESLNDADIAWADTRLYFQHDRAETVF